MTVGDFPTKALDDAAADILRGADVDPSAMMGLLCRESKAERSAICAVLARAYMQAERLDQAHGFAERAWLLSDYAPELLPAYLEIQAARGDIESTRAAHKRVGMSHAASGDVAAALRHFNLHHYAYQQAGQGDRYDYDPDILDTIERLAEPYRHRAPASIDGKGEIRVAYLVFGATHIESVIVKLLCYFARYHDRARFNARFFIPDRHPEAHEVALQQLLNINIRKLKNNKGVVVTAAATREPDNLVEMAARIARFGPHLLVTGAALADYAHYFLACTRPAPVTLGLVYGPPEQYVPPRFDWVTTATRHPLMDSPSDGTLVPIEFDLPARGSVETASRAEFGVPEVGVLVMVVGRTEKMTDRAYWAALSALLLGHPDAFLLVVGAEQPPQFPGEALVPELLARVKMLGYRHDYLRILAMADVLLDTFPSGGGTVLVDAMALGTPLVTFRNDYTRRFDQRQWSPAEELFDVSELIVRRGDFEAFVATAGRLVADPEYRRRMGEACRESVLRLNGKPGRMVARHERVYEEVLRKFRNGELRRSAQGPVARAEALGPPSLAARLLGLARRRAGRGRRSTT